MWTSKRNSKSTIPTLQGQINRFSGLLSPSEVRQVHTKFEEFEKMGVSGKKKGAISNMMFESNRSSRMAMNSTSIGFNASS